tara:strand:- start:10 stop:213 length:204 start_codon:yes stop_codon:yes gene_type:complete
MLKYALISIGFLFLIEGLLYFFFTQYMKDMMKVIENLEVEKIKTIASIISIIGASLIYFTIRGYDIS